MRFTCSCGQPLQVNDDLAGQRVKCPKCGEAILVREDGIQPEAARLATRPKLSQDDDDMSPRQRRRFDTFDEDAPPVRSASVLGIVSLVLGILGALISLFPCVGMFVGGPLAGIGLFLGLIGLIVALKTKRHGMGMPIAGSVVSFLGLCIAGAWLAFSTLVIHQAGKNAEVEAAKVEQQKQAIREGPAIDVTVAAILKEYLANSLAADRKYKEKVLALTGEVERVVHEDKDVTVKLTSDEEESVDCVFRGGPKNELADLNPGQKVTIRGWCKGQEDGTLTLEHCVLVTKGKP